MKKLTLPQNGLPEETGWRAAVKKLPLYVLLTAFALLYIEPLIYIFSMSFKSTSDLTNATAKWIPQNPSLLNLEYAFDSMKVKITFLEKYSLWENLMRSTIFVSVVTSFLPALIQVYTCAIAGYAFARINFWGKKLLFVLLLLSYIIPPQTVVMPLIWIYRTLGIINTPLSFILPAVFGCGLKGSLFIVIYMQFFKKLPAQLEEAAYIDGAGVLGTMFKVMVPNARTIMLTVFIFSFCWQYTDTAYSSLFFYDKPVFANVINAIYIRVGLNADILGTFITRNAAAMLIIIPLIVLFCFCQRFFLKSVILSGMAN